MEEKKEHSEQEYLQYVGNKFPRVLRLVWTGFVVFLVIYIGKYCIPDLLQWLK